MQIFPSHNQWRRWSLPSKLTAIGAYVGTFGITLTIAIFAFQVYQAPQEPEDIAADWAMVNLSGALRDLRVSIVVGRMVLAACRRDLEREGKISDTNLRSLVRALEKNGAATTEFTKRFEEFEVFGKLVIDHGREAVCQEVVTSFAEARALAERSRPRLIHMYGNPSTDQAPVEIINGVEEFFDVEERLVKTVDDCVFPNGLTR